ncbi:hypothetical protein ACO0LM_27300 [Undibacterium sp. Di26W]|uniref:hypothetical protein n=1 Tax=Undibacterium sp. Di26W TaxID=3413035 RepID=UPI003BF384FF
MQPKNGQHQGYQHRNAGPQNSVMAQALKKSGAVEQRIDETISIQASYAIASNLAYSQIMHFLDCKRTDHVPDVLKSLGEEVSGLLTLVTYQRQCAENKQAPDEKKKAELQGQLTTFNTHEKGFERLWARLMRPLSEARRPYYSSAERKLLMFELMMLCQNLRNLYSHWIPVEEKKVNALRLTGKPQFTTFLEFLYAQAGSRLSLPQWFSLVERKADPSDAEKNLFSLNETFGPAFIFSLFNTRSQVQRLQQGLRLRIKTRQQPRALKRRENQLYLFYARRDGYSETQLDQHSALLREIVGYLNLPPLESAVGQKAKLEWDVLLKKKIADNSNSDNDATPQFRRSSKHMVYALQTLDKLKLLPEWSFAGHHQHVNHDGADEEDAFWESDLRPGDEIPSKHGHAERSKTGMQTQYGRNKNTDQSQRFVYDLRDPNLRFQLTLNGKAVVGVMRERDFCNLVFFALSKVDDAKKITAYAYKWLEQYQSSLSLTHTSEASWSDILQNQSDLKAKHYPRQIQWKIKGTGPDLKTRLQNSVAARLQRLQHMDQLCVLPKRDQHGRKEDRSESDLPKHEKIHELLHMFIRHLNAEGRSKVTQREYSHLQQLLLSYKGADGYGEIESIKAESIDAELKHDRVYTDKAKFWQHLHHTYTPNLVNTTDKAKTHPIWVHCLVEGKARDRSGNERPVKNIPGLDKLFKRVLQDEIQDLLRVQKRIGTADCNETELKQIAFCLQVSLMDERHTGDAAPMPEQKGEQEKASPQFGYAKARHDALRYSVLPASICQQALGLAWEMQIAINKQGQENRYPGLAQQIRGHAGSRTLRAEFYQPGLVMPQVQAKLQRAGRLDCLAPGEKKLWKECVKNLNDWHTHDKLCLLMVEQLAKQAQIQLGTGSIADYYSQAVLLEKKGPNHQGQEVSVTFKLSNSLQSTRHWFAWSATKLERALCWHFKDGVTVDSGELQQMMNTYQTRSKGVIEQVLTLEKSVLERLEARKNSELIVQVKRDGYVPFKTIMSQVVGWNDQQRQALIHLRNMALHDGLPQHKFLKDLYSDAAYKQAWLDAKQLGEPQLDQIKKAMQTG